MTQLAVSWDRTCRSEDIHNVKADHFHKEHDNCIERENYRKDSCHHVLVLQGYLSRSQGNGLGTLIPLAFLLFDWYQS